MNTISIILESQKVISSPKIPASKSISNRVLIIQALSDHPIIISSISDSNDTRVLQNALKSKSKRINIEDAGTAMRFLLAYFFAKKQEVEIYGTNRMHERPIGPLVDALMQLGAEIKYLGKPGCPPVVLSHKIQNLKKLPDRVTIDTSHSSQFLSAIMLIGPTLPRGISIKLTGKKSSWSYVNLTISILQEFGISVSVDDKWIRILPQAFSKQKFEIENDWSATSFWYLITSLLPKSEFYLKGLESNSSQGDSIAPFIFKGLGVHTDAKHNGIKIYNGIPKPIPEEFSFNDNPDLALPFIVACAAQKRKVILKGLETLELKETNRILALKNELIKFNVIFTEFQPGRWLLDGTEFLFSEQLIETYNDHRIAMSFAPLSVFGKIRISNPSVVNKSYPGFWDDLKSAGFTINYE